MITSPDSVPADSAAPPRTVARRGAAWGLLALLSALLLAAAFLPSLAPLKQSELLFPAAAHTISELFAVVVAMLIWAVSWNAYRHERPGNIIILACGFLCVGLLDIGHMLSYKGMPDFVTPAAPQKAIVFWLNARYVSALTLLAVALRPWTPLRHSASRYQLLLGALMAAGAVYLLELFSPQVWPPLFVPGQGLTGVKLAAEYGVIAILLAALLLFWRSRKGLAEADGLLTATAITILCELCFTLYANVNDIFSLLGHAYKVIAYMYIYQAVFVSSVREPFLRLSGAMRARKQAEARIAFMAYHDPPPAGPTRAGGRERFTLAARAASARGGSMAILFIDLDNFKQINDSLGHMIGDQVLCEVSARLCALAGAEDTVSRQGGDEFLLLLADGSGAPALLTALLDSVQRPILCAGHELSLSMSAGVARFPADGADFDTLTQKADTALYCAKAAGRNGWRFFEDEMLRHAEQRMSIRGGLRQALEGGQFLLHYQPQRSLADGALTGVEALIRWQRPGHGMVPPGQFIGVAEECGLIVPIGSWVLHEACRQMAAWRAAGLAIPLVAVNLSALQFLRGDLVATVSAALGAAGLPPACLELELTESILISDSELVLNVVTELRAIGVRLSIDDFGTGYSSLSYLKRFAVDKLKIDQSFVTRLRPDSGEFAIVRAIIQMAHSLGLTTIAEGVEDLEVLELLRSLGCEEAQGYYFSRPLAAEALLPYLQSRPEVVLALH